MSSHFSHTQLAELMPARAQAAGEIMTVDVNFIESAPLATNRDAEQALTDSSPHSQVGDPGATVHAPGIAAARGLSYGIGRYEAAVPVRQLEMELT